MGERWEIAKPAKTCNLFSVSRVCPGIYSQLDWDCSVWRSSSSALSPLALNDHIPQPISKGVPIHLPEETHFCPFDFIHSVATHSLWPQVMVWMQISSFAFMTSSLSTTTVQCGSGITAKAAPIGSINSRGENEPPTPLTCEDDPEIMALLCLKATNLQTGVSTPHFSSWEPWP